MDIETARALRGDLYNLCKIAYPSDDALCLSAYQYIGKLKRKHYTAVLDQEIEAMIDQIDLNSERADVAAALEEYEDWLAYKSGGGNDSQNA